MKANDNEVISEEKRAAMIEGLEVLYRKMLKTLNFDIDDPQIRDTPKRMAKMYVNELFAGCYEPPPKLTIFKNEKYGTDNSFVFLGPIDVKSTCSHHFLPFVGKLYIGYMPGENVVGISKLPRVVNWFMRRPQIQEEFTSQLCKYLSEQLECKDLIVHCEASHMCMTLRGVQQPLNSIMATTYSVGTLFTKGEDRDGFFDQVSRSK